jgi:alkanesulfonate monooxygenase SsuD/methylene tetrahydromethanopterin reductase-like flavin-dependent oxidoreductase (luciferase family)
MCDGAGIEALWVPDHLAFPDGERLEAWTALTLMSPALFRARTGVTVTPAFRPVATLAAMAGTLDAAIGGRLELCLSAGSFERTIEPEVPALIEYADRLRGLLSEGAAAFGSNTHAAPGVASPQPGGPPLSVEARTPNQIDVAARIADDVLLPAGTVADLVAATARVRAACERVGRDPATLGIALEAPLSIGRTRAEAEARAHGESVFEVLGSPSQVGVFGTLEECQERVVELAHAGISDLRFVLPNNPDIHDVIAQLTAIAIGTVDVLTPGAPRSKDPDPPETWGGRRNRPATG